MVKLHYSLLLIRPQQSLTPRLSTGTTAAPRTVPTVTPQVVTNIQRMPTARVDSPTLLLPSDSANQRKEERGDVEVICLDSDSDDEGSSIDRSSHVNATRSGVGDSLADSTASQCLGRATQTVSLSANGTLKGSSPPVVVVHQQGVFPSSNTAASRASPFHLTFPQSPARTQATISSTDISPSLATSPALAATIANILASAKGGAIRVGDVVATNIGTANCPPSSVSLSSFATSSGEPPSVPRAHATQTGLSQSIADLVQYSQQLSRLNHMQPQQGTGSLAASPHKSSLQQQTQSIVDPLITTSQLLTSQPQAVSSNWQRMIPNLYVTYVYINSIRFYSGTLLIWTLLSPYNTS